MIVWWWIEELELAIGVDVLNRVGGGLSSMTV